MMRQAYREELKLIEDVMMQERRLAIEANDRKWEDLYRKRENEEVDQCQKKFDRLEQFVREMDEIRVSHQERYRQVKIRLENELGEIQREFERLKTACAMNGEKLDYNFQVLRRREDENLIINSQQKRRINKLQDVVDALRKGTREYGASTAAEISKLGVEVDNLKKCVGEIESKAAMLAEANDSKYWKVWELNVRSAEEVLGRILAIDEILCEQQLGLEWRKPELGLLEKGDLPSYSQAVKLIQEDGECHFELP